MRKGEEMRDVAPSETEPSRIAVQALSFYASADLYAPLIYKDGPGTLPILAADQGRIAREAIAQIESLPAGRSGAKSMANHSNASEVGQYLPHREGQ